MLAVFAVIFLTRLMRTSSGTGGLELLFGRHYVRWHQGDVVGIVVEKAGDSDRLFTVVVDFSAVGARVALVAHPDVLFWFLVGDDPALEVAEHDLVFVLGNDVVGVNRNLPSTARSIDHEGRHRETRNVAPEVLHDLDALGNGRPKMFEALGEITLIDVVRPNPIRGELVHELAHQSPAVVDAAKKHALISEGNSGIGHEPERLLGFRCELLRNVEVGVDEDRVVPAEHLDESGRDALRHGDGHTGAERMTSTDGASLRSRLHDMLDPIIGEKKRISPRKEDVADLRVSTSDTRGRHRAHCPRSARGAPRSSAFGCSAGTAWRTRA